MSMQDEPRARPRRASDIDAEARSAQRLAHLGSWFWDAASDATTGSDELLRIFGLDPTTDDLPAFADQRGRCYPEDEWDRLNAAVQRALHTGDGYELDLRAIGADGRSLWVTTRGEVVTDEARRVVGLRGTLQDITARVEAEQVLRANHRRRAFFFELAERLRDLSEARAMIDVATRSLAEFLDVPHVGFGVVAADRRHVVVGHEWRADGRPSVAGTWEMDAFGDSLVADLRRGQTVAIADITRDSRTRASPVAAAYDAIATRATLDVPLVKDGHLEALLFALHPAPHAWSAEDVGVAEETAERLWSAVQRARAEDALRERESRYRTLFESIDQGFCLVEVILDLEGAPTDYRILEANPAFAAHTGLRNATGRLVRGDLVPAIEPFWIETYGRVALTGESIRFENRAAGLDGGWFEVYAFRVGTPDQRQVAIFFSNITRRRQSEEALRENEQRLQLALRAGRTGVWDWDLRTGRVMWSAETYDVFGMPPGTFGGTIGHFDALVHPDDRDGVRRTVAAAIDNGHPDYADAFRIVRPDGAIRRITNLAAIRRDAAGAAVSIVGTVTDVTDHHAAHEALRESERQLRLQVAEFETLLDVLPIGIGVSRDRDCGSIRTNPAFARVLGLTTGQNASKTAPTGERPTTFVCVDDQGREIAGEDLPMQIAARTGTTVSGLELNVVHEDRRVVRLLEYAAPLFDEHGDPRGCVGAFVDVTDRALAAAELRASEQRFRQLADAMPLIVWTARPDGYLDYYNDRWYAYTGFERGGGGDMSWEPILHADDVAMCRDRWYASVASGEPYEIEYRFFDRIHGTYRWHIGRALPVRDDAGAVVKWFGTCVDIEDIKRALSERERAFERERAARAEAERAGQMKDEFLATLSHELRTPLNAILGWADIVGRSPSEEEVRHGVEVIHRNARAQTQIVEDLLDMSRIVSGKVRLDMQPMSLEALVAATVDTVRPAAEAKRLHVTVESEPQNGLIVGDPARLQQVMWNLLANAVKFTSRGGHVQVRVRYVDGDAELSVSDDGQGIGLDFLPHVFERFRQAQGGTTRQHGGLGLGLALVKSLVELHGGTVQATSGGPGRGATFTVRLPMLQQPSSPPAADASASSPKGTAKGPDASNPPLLHRLTVLVVEDEPDTQELLETILRRAGAHVVLAASAAEARRVIATGMHVDVLLSDIGMPVEDGYELVRDLRQSEDGTALLPAVALTAYARPEERARAFRAGFQSHVSKPVHADELIAVIAALAGRHGEARADRANA